MNKKVIDMLVEISEESTYTNDDSENSSESLLFLALIKFHEEEMLFDVCVVHGIEDCHANPEPNVEGSESTAEVPTTLETLHAASQSHFNFTSLRIIISINILYLKQLF